MKKYWIYWIKNLIVFEKCLLQDNCNQDLDKGQNVV